MTEFNIKLAGHTVRIKSRYEDNKLRFKDYLTEDFAEPEIISSVTDEELERTTEAMPDVSREFAEFTGLYRPIAERMPSLGGFVFHGAAISFGNNGYIFTAPSGTGKSTHIKLWRKYLGKMADIVNGDKPIITLENGSAFVHGTPWAGKERWQKNRKLPLRGICLLRRGESCTSRDTDIDESLPFLLPQTYMSQDPDVMGKTMELLDGIYGCVKIVTLYCDISEDAVRCSFEKLTNLNYDEYRQYKTESDGDL